CAGMSAILAVSFPLINFRSNGLCPPSGGFFI
ncbi:host specificity J domain protein, partial [Escherichia coli EC1847]